MYLLVRESVVKAYLGTIGIYIDPLHLLPVLFKGPKLKLTWILGAMGKNCFSHVTSCPTMEENLAFIDPCYFCLSKYITSSNGVLPT